MSTPSYQPIDLVVVDDELKRKGATNNGGGSADCSPSSDAPAVLDVRDELLTPALRAKAMVLIGCLVSINIACLLGLFSVGAKFPALISPGLLAFTFGLRHAVDADHIAAIDNVTRKLIGDGKRPLTVGLWFSLGHSTIVVVLCVAVSLGSAWMRDHISDAQVTSRLC